MSRYAFLYNNICMRTVIYPCSFDNPSCTLRIIFVRSYSLSYWEDVMKYADRLRIMPQRYYNNGILSSLINTIIIKIILHTYL